MKPDDEDEAGEEGQGQGALEVVREGGDSSTASAPGELDKFDSDDEMDGGMGLGLGGKKKKGKKNMTLMDMAEEDKPVFVEESGEEDEEDEWINVKK